MSCQFYCIRNPWKRGYYYGKIIDYTPGLGKILFLGDFPDNILLKMKLMSGTKQGILCTRTLSKLNVYLNIL